MKKFSQEEFIQRCIDKFDNKFDYSLVEYKNFRTPVKIICPVHGIFEITPLNFLGTNIYGCPQCGIEAKTGKISKDEFLKRAHEKFGNKFDFSKMIYVNFKTNIEIICPIHGSFWMTPQHFLDRRHGCPKCAQIEGNKKETMTQKEFIRRAKEAHGNKYDYSKVIYINSYTPVEIICPLHGPFWQNPSAHISKRHPSGCPVCCESFGERSIRVFLEKYKISFNSQKEFEDCRYKDTLPFDFYLPDFNICIEYQGKQHYEPQEYFGGIKTFELVQIRDNIKREFCKKENINLIEIPYWEKDITKILEKLLLKENTNIID